MEFKTEKIVAYGIVVLLFLVGVICYAAFPQKTPNEPIRIMLKSTAGKVLFDHKEHASEDGYAIDCIDCHHAWDEDPEIKPLPCGECHDVESEDEEIPKRSDAFHDQCIGCHEDVGDGPTDCALCHVL